MSQPRVSGQFVQAFLMSAGDVSPVFERKAREYLEDNGIEDVSADDWYPYDQFANAMNDIEEEVGRMTSKEAGRKMVEIIEEMSDLKSIEKAVELGKKHTRQAYQNYSPERVGQMRYESLKNGHHRVAYHGGWEYPEGFTRGIFRGHAQATRGLESADIEPTDTRPDETYAYIVEP
jgi:hypothetical protein